MTNWKTEFDEKFLSPDPNSGLPCYTQHPDVMKEWIEELLRVRMISVVEALADIIPDRYAGSEHRGELIWEYMQEIARSINYRVGRGEDE